MLSGGWGNVVKVVSNKKDYWCDNGTKKDGRSSDNHDNRHKCKICDTNYNLVKERCLRYYLHSCKNGIPVNTMVYSPEEQDNICKKCNTGYIKFEDKYCELPSEKYCDNGTPKKDFVLFPDLIKARHKLEEFIKNAIKELEKKVTALNILRKKEKNNLIEYVKKEMLLLYARGMWSEGNRLFANFKKDIIEWEEKTKILINTETQNTTNSINDQKSAYKNYVKNYNKGILHDCDSCNDRYSISGNFCEKTITTLNWNCERTVEHIFLPSKKSIDSYHYLSWLSNFGLHKDNLPNVGFLKDGENYYIDISLLKKIDKTKLPAADLDNWTINGTLWFCDPDELEWGPNSFKMNCKIVYLAFLNLLFLKYEYYQTYHIVHFLIKFQLLLCN